MESLPEAEDMSNREYVESPMIGRASILNEFIAPDQDRSLPDMQSKKKELVTVTRKNSQGNSKGERVGAINKEEAVCKKCCKYMFPENIVLWAKCKCKLALIHETCATKWFDEKGSTCDFCGEEIKNISVTLTMDVPTSSPQQSTAAQLEKPKKRYRRWFP